MKFHLDNPIFDFINTICNFIILNFIFLITCIPIITIGSATTSLYVVTMREARGEYGYLVRTYLKEFKSNLKLGTILFMSLFLPAAIFFFNFIFWENLESIVSIIITVLMGIACLLCYLTSIYVFPLSARFYNSPHQTLKNSLLIAISNPLTTLKLIFIDAFTICTFLYFSPMKIFMMLFGFAFLTYLKSFSLHKVFQIYIDA